MEIIRPADEANGVSRRLGGGRPPVETTRRLILRAAERLYGRNGFGGVSLRQIAVAARQGNNNAVQYHFGGRERLIETIFADRVGEMEQERQAMLAKAEQAGRLDDLDALMAIVSLPHLSLCDENGHHPHAGFMLHYIVRGMSSPGSRLPLPAAAPAAARLFDLVRRQVRDVPGELADVRITLSTMMFLNFLAWHDGVNPRRGDPAMLARHGRSVIGAMAAAIRGPASDDGQA